MSARRSNPSRSSTPPTGTPTSEADKSGPILEGIQADDGGPKHERPRTEPPRLPDPPKAPDPFVRDPECAELHRHRPNCDCKGDARKPIE